MARYGTMDVINGCKNHKRAFSVWNNMLERCYNPNNNRFNIYGGRGVSVCEEWKLFSNFLAWYEDNYIEGFQMDKDLSGMNCYCPKGCKFISPRDNTKLAVSGRDNSYQTGDKNYFAKPKKYYESNPQYRSNFNKVCSNRGWNILEFVEVYQGYASRKDGRQEKVYTYIYDPNNSEKSRLEFNYINPSFRVDFRRYCNKFGIAFEDFEEIFHSDVHIYGNVYKKKYVYKFKKIY